MFLHEVCLPDIFLLEVVLPEVFLLGVFLLEVFLPEVFLPDIFLLEVFQLEVFQLEAFLPELVANQGHSLTSTLPCKLCLYSSAKLRHTWLQLVVLDSVMAAEFDTWSSMRQLEVAG